MIFLLVAAALVVGTPLMATVLVTIASLREDSHRSLTGRPPGILTAAARKLLYYRSGAPEAGRGPQDAGRARHKDDESHVTQRVPRPRPADAGDITQRVPRPRPSDQETFEHSLTLPRS